MMKDCGGRFTFVSINLLGCQIKIDRRFFSFRKDCDLSDPYSNYLPLRQLNLQHIKKNKHTGAFGSISLPKLGDQFFVLEKARRIKTNLIEKESSTSKK